MTIKPAYYPLRIPQRATLDLQVTLPFSGVGKTIVAQIWNDTRTVKLLDLTPTWTDQPGGVLKLTATRQQTETVTKDGQWDLLVIDDATDRGDYYLEGPAQLDTGYSDDA